MARDYDVVVLGAGPGGYPAAIRASQLGKKTAIVEKKYWGGVCLNVGCIPSKALLRNAELVNIVRHEAEMFGLRIEGKVSFDYAQAFARSRRVAEGRTRGVRFLMKKNQIDTYEGWGTFSGPNALEVALNTGGQETLRFKNAILAPGATTRLLPGTKLSERVVTYEEQILQDSLPGRIVIAGAGAIGVEFAYVMNAYGVEVTLVEFLDRVVPLEDPDVSAELHKRFVRRGIKIFTKTKVESIEDTGTGARVTVTGADGARQVLETDRVLQAIGFRPRVQGYALEATGLKPDERGIVEIDAHMRTRVPHLSMIGDATGKMMLAHVAEVMGIVAAESIAGAHTVGLDYDMMPRATYCQPQIAAFGYTEAQARDKGFDVNVSSFPFSASGKAHGLGDTTGFVKLVADKKYGEILGAHMIGPDVTELLPELTLARQSELTVEEIARNVHSHPTLSEAIKDAAHGLLGHSINL
jgi:dihydrolipoyl dehydrogenase